jgi:hypothetical protein
VPSTVQRKRTAPFERQYFQKAPTSGQDHNTGTADDFYSRSDDVLALAAHGTQTFYPADALVSFTRKTNTDSSELRNTIVSPASSASASSSPGVKMCS